MAEPAKPPEGGSLRELAEKTLLAGFGVLDAAKDQAQETIGSAAAGQPLLERARGALAGLADDLGLVTRERYEELELKVAQLEHRVRLLEEGQASPGSPSSDG